MSLIPGVVPVLISWVIWELLLLGVAILVNQLLSVPKPIWSQGSLGILNGVGFLVGGLGVLALGFGMGLR